jgi:hypothetical protein
MDDHLDSLYPKRVRFAEQKSRCLSGGSHVPKAEIDCVPRFSMWEPSKATLNLPIISPKLAFTAWMNSDFLTSYQDRSCQVLLNSTGFRMTTMGDRPNKPSQFEWSRREFLRTFHPDAQKISFWPPEHSLHASPDTFQMCPAISLSGRNPPACMFHIRA